MIGSGICFFLGIIGICLIGLHDSLILSWFLVGYHCFLVLLYGWLWSIVSMSVTILHTILSSDFLSDLTLIYINSFAWLGVLVSLFYLVG